MAVIDERREVSDFTEIQMEGSGDLLITQGDVEGLIITADEDLMPRLKSEVHAGRLELGLRHWYDMVALLSSPSIRYQVTVRSLRAVTIAGAGRMEAGPLQCERLRLKINGSGEMVLPALDSSELEIVISGSGKVELSGGARRSEIDISGSGDILAETLAGQEASVRISGSGSARLQVSQRLDVNISGSGDVCYHGAPQVQYRISGSGSVRRLE